MGRFGLLALRMRTKEGEVCEDRVAARPERGSWALCDGASACQDGGGWASVLAATLAEAGLESGLDGTLERARARYARREVKRSSEPAKGAAGADWLRQAAARRGSFSTALLAQVSPNAARLHVAACGDSVLFLLEGFRPLASFPLESPEAFDDSPPLLGSRPGQEEPFLRRSYDLRALRRPRFALASDALAAYLLGLGPERAEARFRAFVLEDEAAFGAFVRQETESGRLRRDDLTCLVVG